MHSSLKPIKSSQLGFQNNASHFFFIQIFQIDFSTLPLILSASNYFRYIFLSFYICRGQNEHFSINSMRKKGRVEGVKYFTQITGAQIFAKHQFQLSNLDFTMKSASLSNAILSFFSRHGLYFYPTKDRCSTRPTSTFFVRLLLFWSNFLHQRPPIFFCAKYGS